MVGDCVASNELTEVAEISTVDYRTKS